jgi:hypothetical protein
MSQKEYNNISPRHPMQIRDLLIAEYTRVTSLEVARLGLMEKILRAYIAVTSAVTAGIIIIVEKGPDLNIPKTTSNALLFALFVFGVVTLFRMVNSNIALLELAARLKALRQYFVDQDTDVSKYFVGSLIYNPQRMKEWASVKGISYRFIIRGGEKGYLSIITLFNSACTGVIALFVTGGALCLNSLSIQALVISLGVFIITGFLHILYISYRYKGALKQIKTKMLSTLI